MTGVHNTVTDSLATVQESLQSPSCCNNLNHSHIILLSTVTHLFCICIIVFNLNLRWLEVDGCSVLMFWWICPAGLTMHASILAYMFNLVEEGKITTGLNPGNPSNNQLFIQEYVANLLKTAFPHLQEWVETNNTVCLVLKFACFSDGCVCLR